MAAVREWIFLVGGSDTTSDTTSWWVSERLPWVLKRAFFHRLWCNVQYTWTPWRSFWLFFYSCMCIVYKVNKLAEGLFSFNILSNQLIYTNWFLHPIILWFDELLLNSNHDFYHRVDMLHHGVHYIFHILCCRCSDILMLSGLRWWKYSSILFDQ